MPKFGSKSLQRREQCHPLLQSILDEAIKLYDFTILESFRDKEAQDRLYNEGKSKLKFPNSKHNELPSLAVDIAPYPIDWNDKERFHYLAGIMFAVANQKNIKIRWGGDWNCNTDFKDQKWYDLPHFELLF